MARPRGEVRDVLAQTLARLVAQRGAVNARQLAEASQVGYDKTRRTLHDMVEAGDAVVVGSDKAAGANRWHNLYEPPAAPAASAEFADLAEVVRVWQAHE